MMTQEFVNQINKAGQISRSNYHLTLGKLIKVLEENLHMAVLLEGGFTISNPHSYRGHYSDLAFESSKQNQVAIDLLPMVKECLGKTFQGYKGGDYVMDENTPLWLADYGSCGLAIIDFEINCGRIFLETKEVD